VRVEGGKLGDGLLNAPWSNLAEMSRAQIPPSSYLA
jgi:hypothetical protein